MAARREQRSLEQVTQELIALQTISSAMISTSYLDDVLKIIAEGLEKGLNFEAGILFILDRQKDSLYPHVTHHNTFINVLEKHLKTPLNAMSISIEEKKNKLALAVQQQKIVTTQKISELLRGSGLNISDDFDEAFAKMTAVKTYVVIPMIIRQEIAGLIVCATVMSTITEPIMESLKNFANQAGLAVDNAQIMNSLKSTQSELSRKNERLNQALEDLKNLEALKEGLVGMVVHDLKNPLTSVRGYLELILENTGSKDEFANIREYVGNAYEGSEDLLKMIHNLLDVSRMEEHKFSLNLSRQRIEDVINAVHDQLVVVATKNHRSLEVSYKTELPIFEMDCDILQRVVANLISNAIKHTQKGGVIKVRAEEDGLSSVRVCVEDDGEGIPPEYIEKIFEKFTQVKDKKYKNTHNVGLGLTFCKLAVETHGGKIWVESVLDKGSKFYFSIPYRKATGNT